LPSIRYPPPSPSGIFGINILGSFGDVISNKSLISLDNDCVCTSDSLLFAEVLGTVGEYFDFIVSIVVG
jgi:hypothetical protein